VRQAYKKQTTMVGRFSAETLCHSGYQSFAFYFAFYFDTIQYNTIGNVVAIRM
jgi:hypothetical protein